MRTGSILFLLGIILLIESPHLPPSILALLLPITIIPLLKSSRWRWPAWLLCGFLWALLRADVILSENMDEQIEGVPLTASGRVISLPVNRGTQIRFDFQVDSLTGAGGKRYGAPHKIRLNWYRNYPDLSPGESWRLAVKLKRPHGFMNPGGFDYEGFLFQQGIGATGYVLNRADNVRLSMASGFNIDRIRFLIRRKLEKVLPDQQLAPLVTALVIGDRSAVTPVQWRILTRTGTNHLLAISGLHIGLIAALTLILARWLWPVTLGVLFKINSLRVAAVTAMTCALIYAALAGFSIPTQRALIMLAIVLLLGFVNRITHASNIICLTLLIILLIDPFSVMSSGFWLSFTAVNLILYGMTCRTGTTGFWWRWGRVQWLVGAGLAPLLISSYQQVPLLGIVANFIAVPWVSMLTIPLLLIGVSLSFIHEGIGSMILHMGLASLKLLWGFLELVSHFDAGVLHTALPSLTALMAAMIGVALLLLPRGLPGRWLGMLWMLPVFIQTPSFPDGAIFRFTLLDVGQGLAAVVRTRHHTLLFDTGPKYSDRFDAGSDVILPYLKYQGVNRLDRLIASHGDNDHIGGLPQLLLNIDIDAISSSVPEKIRNFHASRCRAGDAWDWDGVHFAILYPASAEDLSGNDLSCVLRVSSGTHSLLLTGDIERRAEQRLVMRYPGHLRSELLVAPHHGSDTSSSQSFIAAVQPHYVLFPVGYRNRYNFPKKAIIHRYEISGAVPLDTASSGAIEAVFYEQGTVITRSRQRLHRFWNAEK